MTADGVFPDAARWPLVDLARKLRPGLVATVRTSPDLLVVDAGGRTIEIEVTAAVTVGGGVQVAYRERKSGRLYGSVADVETAAARIRREIDEAAKRDLIEAHEGLLRHVPSRESRCEICAESMPCTVVAGYVRTLLDYRHLDAREATVAEQGAHVCRVWIHPYRY